MAGFFSTMTVFEKNDSKNVSGIASVEKLFTVDLPPLDKNKPENSTAIRKNSIMYSEESKLEVEVTETQRKIMVIPITTQPMFPRKSSKNYNRKFTKIKKTIPDPIVDDLLSSDTSVSKSSFDSSQSDSESSIRKKSFVVESRLWNAAMKPISSECQANKLPHTYATTRKLLIKEDNVEEDAIPTSPTTNRCFATIAVASPLLFSSNRKQPRIAECKSLLKTNDNVQKTIRFERKGCCENDNKNVSNGKKESKQKFEELLRKMNCCISPKRSDQLVQEENLKILQSNMFYDSHCHLDYIFNKLRKVSGNLNFWMQKYPEAFPEAFGGCFPNFIDPELFVESLKSDTYDIEWIKSEIHNPLVVGCSFGCHPRYASLCTDDFVKTIESFCSDFGAYKVKAIGECGLDFHRSNESFEVQVRALQRQIGLATRFNLPMVIHCRSGSIDAEDPCLAVLASHKYLSRFHNIHRHCFTGSWETAQKWISYFPNIYFGYTSGCCNFGSNSDEMEAFRKIPLDRILLETDAPYFKPTTFSNIPTGTVALPGMAISVAECLAKERNLSVDAVIQQTSRNFARMYVFPIEEIEYS